MKIENGSPIKRVPSVEQMNFKERMHSTGKNITIMSKTAQENSRVGKEPDGRSGKTVFAGEMKGDFSLSDRIKERKERAQEKALKVVNDAWGGDRKIGETLGRSKEHLGRLQQENSGFRAETNELTRQSEALAAEYQVEPDSEQQQELDLLNKEEAARYQMLSGVELTEEEEEQLARIHEKELTEYQSRALELKKRIWVDRREIFDNEKGTVNELGIETENAVIRGIREEGRKAHSVLDAGKQAEEIMKSAGDEIINMAVNDAKDYLEETQKEREEEGAELKEEKEKQEEILKEREEKEKELEELLEEMPMDQMNDGAQTLSAVKRQIQNIVNEMNLVVEDIKGSQVDKSL